MEICFLFFHRGSIPNKKQLAGDLEAVNINHSEVGILTHSHSVFCPVSLPDARPSASLLLLKGFSC